MHRVIGSSANGELVPLGNQGLCQGACIGHNGLGVFHKSRCVHLQKLRRQGSDPVVMKNPTLGKIQHQPFLQHKRVIEPCFVVDAGVPVHAKNVNSGDGAQVMQHKRKAKET